MDNELFELCKEVYKRAGWSPENDSDIWVHDDEQPVHPLYTSDYLLEKLPRHHGEGWANPLTITGDKVYDGRGGKDMWLTNYEHTEMSAWSDTPLKALLKLVIALDDAKELK